MPANDNTLEIKIQSTRGTKEFSFPKTGKVAEVIAQAILAFGFASGDTFELMFAANLGEPLQPERPLVSYGMEDGVVLVLTAIGTGV
jgi:hypothetical protein